MNAGNDVEAYGDGDTQECGKVKGGIVVVINMTAWSFLAAKLYWPKHVNLSHVAHKCH